jgi:hypothetical protein
MLIFVYNEPLKTTDNSQQTTDFGYSVTEPVEVPNYAFDKLRQRLLLEAHCSRLITPKR